MKLLKPKTHIIAETSIDFSGLEEALDTLQVANYKAEDSAEDLIAFAGRLCYNSFDSESTVNLNITHTRTDLDSYIHNLIQQGHEAVLEHATVTVLFSNISRIMSHELVRHRAGMAYSQESGRYVRRAELEITDTGLVDLPEDFSRKLTELVYQEMENQQDTLDKINSLDWDNLNFHQKKVATSYARRMMGNGHCTNLLVTGNHRAWRHIFRLRTSSFAETEIREVMLDLLKVFKERYPLLYQDINV